MPYSQEHKLSTRQKIVEQARQLFNQHGFEKVSIDEIMTSAGLTRGGFYNHFNSKEELYAEAVDSFLFGMGKQWRDQAGVEENTGLNAVMAMVNSYLSDQHLSELENQCPMIALPSDIARSNSQVKQSYERLLLAMVGLFENNLNGEEKRETALSLASLCVGGMVISRTIENESLAKEIKSATLCLITKSIDLKNLDAKNLNQ